MVFGVFSALAAICPLPAASCCGPILDVARYAFKLSRSNLLAGSRHLAASSNDIFGFNGLNLAVSSVLPIFALTFKRSPLMLEWMFLAGRVATVVLNLLYLCLVVGTIVVVISGNRNPVKTIAWVLVLVFLPVVGLVLYFFIGQDQRRIRIINKKLYGRLMKKSRMQFIEQGQPPIPQEHARLISLFRDLCQAYPFDGNDITVYTRGSTMLQALLREMQQAHDHIHLESYIIEDDAIGRMIRDVLIERASRGVRVRLLYDDVGCWHVPQSFFERMKECGIEVYSFLKVRMPLFASRMNYRNHRKVIVVDGRVGFIGGMNLAERYVRGLPWGNWRDTHLRIQGRAVYALQTTFLLDWYLMDRTLLTKSRYFPRIEPQGTSLTQIVVSEPVGEWRGIMQGVCLALAQAQRYFYIQTPYFLPTEAVLVAMQTAALAGVDVRLMIPMRTDNRLTHIGSRSYLADVLRAGVKVYLYKKGFLHSKMMVADDVLCTVGSTNVDFRSFEHNFEANAFIYDAEVALQMREIFALDQRDSVQVFLKNWMKRPWWKKALESVVRMLAPLL